MSVPSNNSTVYTLGPEYSFSDILARKLYPDKEIIHLKTNSKLVEKASQGETVLVPCENSVAGPVGETIRKLRDKDNLYINKEIYAPINQCLGGLESSEENSINIIYSHQKALDQCRNYLDDNNIESVEAPSTSEAAKTIKEYEKTSIGVICAKEAIQKYKLKLLKENIQDYPNNYTVFWELSDEEKDLDYDKKIGTAMIVDLDNEPGALLRFLKPFDENGVNLYFINSWPENREYWFLTKMEANKYRVHPIKLKRVCKKLRYLGSYNIIDLR